MTPFRLLRLLALAVMVGAVSLPVGACGKRGTPQPPDGGPEQYPRHYPAS